MSDLILANSPGLMRADWIVLGIYFLILIGTGVWFSRRKVTNTQEYFLANHSMPVWAVALSVLATAQSAATFVGVPQTSFSGDLTYLSSNLGGIFAAIILAVFFIPAYYRLNVTTPYKLLETRFGPGARVGASWAYLIGRVFASGARVFVGALPASLAIFGDTAPDHMCIIIVGFVIFGVMYTFFGGVSSVIWTDVVQVTVYLGAALVAIAVLLNKIPADLPTIFSSLANPPEGPSKLNLIDVGLDVSKPKLGFDSSQEFTLLTVMTGFVLLTLASHGMDQDLVQRMLTCKSPAKGALSVVSGVLIGVPAVSIFLVLGLLLYIFYMRPDIMGKAAPSYVPGSDAAFQVFAYREMSGGLAGLFLAGLFAAGPAGINSGLNSMASTFVTDIYRQTNPGKDERHYLYVGRGAVVMAGIALGLFAMLCIALYNPKDGTLIAFVLSVMNFAYAGLLGMFFTALFTRRGSVASVIAGMIAGALVVLIFQPLVWKWWTSLTPWLDSNVGPVIVKYPWQLTIGALVSFAVCCLGSDSKSTGSSRL